MNVRTGLRPCGSDGSPQQRGQPGLVHRPVAVAETASGKADLAKHGRQCQAHPRRLLAVPGPLQRPADRDDGAAGGHPPGQGGDLAGGQSADPRRPRRGFGQAVIDPEQVPLEAVVTGAVGTQEVTIDQRLGGQHVSQRQHDGHVGARHRRMPLALAVDVVAQWRERHDASAPVAQPAQRVACGMGGGAAVVEPGVLQCQPAETHHQIGVFDDDLPLGGAFEQIAVCADHTRHDHSCRAEAIGVS
jgi:hypothetical protein